MKESLNIVIFDGSLKTTPFINRLAEGLAKKHTVYIIGFNNSLTKKITGVNYLALGTSEKPMDLLFHSLKIAAQTLFKVGDFNQFFQIFEYLFTRNLERLKRENFNKAIQLINPDILHIQWPSLLEICRDAITNPEIKTVLSQRGFQNNVRPFVNAENFSELQHYYPKIDGFHSVSKEISKVGDKIFHSPNKIDKVVYSGFDFEKLPFNSNYKKNQCLKLLSIGRPHWVKGYEYALQACAILKAKNINFEYTIVGGQGNEELQFLVDDLGIKEYVQFTGRVPQKQVYEMMRQSDLLLLPSVIEGLPNIAVEAMAVGLPVISTKCGGVEELIVDNETGWLVSVRSPEAFAKAIISFLLVSEDRLEDIRKSARIKVEAQHNEAQMIDEMEVLYFRILDSL
jgi:colanic acid/amylovoran biosynthesis glycosyltransferase